MRLSPGEFSSRLSELEDEYHKAVIRRNRETGIMRLLEEQMIKLEESHIITNPNAASMNAARELGEGAARTAASWTCDGNSDVAERAKVLAMLRDGDPAAYDYLPRYPDLSGEMADDPTPLSLAREVTGEDDPSPELMHELSDAWEEGVNETFSLACEAELITLCEPASVESEQ